MIKNTRIAIMSEFVSSKDNSTGYYWQAIIEWISKEFSGLLVITPKNINISEIEAASYITFPSARLGKNNIFSRLLGQISQVLGFVVNAILKLKPGMVVMTGTNPIALLLFMPVLRSMLRIKWVVLVHDVYPESISISGLIKKDSTIYRLMDSFFSRAYRAADNLIVIGRDMAEILCSKGVNPVAISYQPNWVNMGDVRPMHKSESPLIRDLGWESNVVFQYFGNMGRVQGMGGLLQSIESVNAVNARFLFCGNGVHGEVVRKFCANHANCHYISDSEYERDVILASCDVSLVHLAPGMYGLGVPSKAYFSLAANRPVLVAGDSGSEMDLMLRDYGAGWFVDSADCNNLKNAIEAIAESGVSFKLSPIELYANKFNGSDARDTIVSLINKHL